MEIKKGQFVRLKPNCPSPSKGCVGISESFTHGHNSWADVDIRIQSGSRKGKISRLQNRYLEIITKAEFDRIIEEQKVGDISDSKEYILYYKGGEDQEGFSIHPKEEAIAKAKSHKEIYPSDVVKVYALVGTAQDPVVTVEIK